jgi:hypothetical protein
MSCIADTAGESPEVAFVSSTVVIVYSPFLSVSVCSVLFGKKQRGGRPVLFGDQPYFFVRVCEIGAEEPEPALQAELVFLAVVFVGAKRRPLTEEAGGTGAGFGQEG